MVFPILYKAEDIILKNTTPNIVNRRKILEIPKLIKQFATAGI
jgi:hypothetical protein